MYSRAQRQSIPPFLTRLWEVVKGRVEGIVYGQAKPLSYSRSSIVNSRSLGLEINYAPARDADRARELIEMRKYCPEIGTAISIHKTNILSSEDGDDQGFKISEYADDKYTPVDPKAKEILDRLVGRVLTTEKIKPIIDRFLSYGDAFASIKLDKNITQVEDILILPVWEIFREEDVYGTLERFEQRSGMYNSDALILPPVTTVHWRYERDNLYGRSLFEESKSAWANLKSSIFDIAKASRSVGCNPNVHVLPEGATDEDVEVYRNRYESMLADGIVTDIYTLYGGDVRKLGGGWNPDLAGLINAYNIFKSTIVMQSQLPPFLLGTPQIGARDIAGVPERAMSRTTNSMRQVLTEGLKQICDLELALNDIDPRTTRYRIVYPTIYTNAGVGTGALPDETEGILDTEESVEKVATPSAPSQPSNPQPLRQSPDDEDE